LQAYDNAPVVAVVSLFRGHQKVLESEPTEAHGARALPLEFSLALDKLDPGEYDFEVSVLDPAGQKAAFWNAPVVLIP